MNCTAEGVDVARRKKGSKGAVKSVLGSATFVSGQSEQATCGLLALTDALLLSALLPLLPPVALLRLGATCQRLRSLTSHDTVWAAHYRSARGKAKSNHAGSAPLMKAWREWVAVGLEWEYPGLVHGTHHHHHQYYRQRLAHTSAREWSSSPAHRAARKELARAMRKHQAPQHDYSLKVVVAGDWRVGKDRRHAPPYEEHPDFVPSPLHLFAAAAAAAAAWENPITGFKTVGSSPFRDCDAVIVCFDATAERSFDSAKALVQEIKRYTYDRVLGRMLVGTKWDKRKKRAVPRELPKAFAMEEGIPFAWTSAKKGTGVEEAFRLLVGEMYARGVILHKARNKKPK
ncbi:Ras subfamily protein [Acanthamoeba castellanii str. Neff]|uniref:Ras subfamily protein n=1 Tax=Acanthamoeba castellanii (strain ATCC 30010 / Neff) TaxID=1257118 RepID=L8HC26_ACACF|nr:Ras subfamily protein [Acanthamoeba castellanii str. Neff]ELR22293.1 Ras subfamily protein [Acanthamoeba castellanii str. Neff]